MSQVEKVPALALESDKTAGSKRSADDAGLAVYEVGFAALEEQRKGLPAFAKKMMHANLDGPCTSFNLDSVRHPFGWTPPTVKEWMGAGDCFQIVCWQHGSNALEGFLAFNPPVQKLETTEAVALQKKVDGLLCNMKNEYRELYQAERDRFFAAVEVFQQEYLKNM
jgi:hypothetical protein